MDRSMSHQWADVSFNVASKSVMNYSGFLQLKVEEDRIMLEPFGLELTVQALTPRGAVLESRGHIYLVDCVMDDDIVELTIVRKDNQEEVKIRAEFSQQPKSTPACQLSM